MRFAPLFQVLRIKRFALLALALAALIAVPLLTPGPVVAQNAVTSRGLPDFADLVELAAPAVVNIRTVEKVRVQQPGQGAACRRCQSSMKTIRFTSSFVGSFHPVPIRRVTHAVRVKDQDKKRYRGGGQRVCHLE